MKYKNHIIIGLLFAISIAVTAGSVAYLTASPAHAEACAAGDSPVFANDIGIKDGTAFTNTLDASNITADRTLTLPDNNSVTTGFVAKAADETLTADTTLQADDELFFSVKASTAYAFELTLIVESNSTADFTARLDFPLGASGRWAYDDSASWDLGTTPTIGIVTTNEQLVQINGFITTSTTAGNLTLYWAQDTSNGVNTIVNAGSTMRFWESAN